jgi:cysteate synthase
VGSGSKTDPRWPFWVKAAKASSSPERSHAPIYYAYKHRNPEAGCSEMFDDVLFNRKPPYSIPGGVKDALEATHGQVYGITDQEAQAAKFLFEDTEGIDILNAPGVAVAALNQAVQSDALNPEDIILLNVTGGGVSRVKEDFACNMLQPDITVSRWEEALEFLECKSWNP